MSMKVLSSKLAPDVTPPAIYGQKFHDLDGDHVRQPDEPGLNGWTIELLDAGSGAVVATRLTTDLDLDSDGQIDPTTESGWYWFDNLPPGDYVVREAGQAGWALSAPGLPSFEPHQLLPPQGIPDPDAITTLAVDMDKDGDLDLLVTRRSDGHVVHLWRNDVGQDNNWAVFRLEGDGTTVNRTACGARVTLVSGDLTQIREVQCGRGHASSQPSIAVEFGLGQRTAIDSVTVRWPSADPETDTQIWTAPPIKRFIKLTQGDAGIAFYDE